MVKPNQSQESKQKAAPAATSTAPVADAAPAAPVAPPAAPAADATPRAPSPEERLSAERGAAVEALASAKRASAHALEAEDTIALADAAKAIASAKAIIAECDAALVSARFAPTVHAMLSKAIEAGTLSVPSIGGKLAVQAIFENGKLVQTIPVSIGTLSERKAPVTQRANLRVSGSVDSRTPSAGWGRDMTSHGVTWRVTMLGGNQCQATSPGRETLTGSVGQVTMRIAQAAVNAYKVLGLGEPGTVWSDASPAKGWTKA